MGISEVHHEGHSLTHSPDTTEDFLGPQNGTPFQAADSSSFTQPWDLVEDKERTPQTQFLGVSCSVHLPAASAGPSGWSGEVRRHCVSVVNKQTETEPSKLFHHWGSF